MSESETQTSKKGFWLSILKWAWMVAVIIAFAIYLWRNFGDIVSQLSSFPPHLLLLSLVIAAIGRICFITLSSEVLALLGYQQPPRTVFYLAATSELGKYLPGGVWHLVGRAGYYRILGLPVGIISKALIQENAWMLLSSGMMGTFFLIAAYTEAYWAIAVLALCWWLIVYLWARQAPLWRISAQINLHSLIWLFFAYSFTLLLPDLDRFGFLLAMSAFCISWILGFVILFAPGGLGVREASLVALLLPIMPASEILVYALVHRLLWILIEFGFGLFAWFFLDLQERS